MDSVPACALASCLEVQLLEDRAARLLGRRRVHGAVCGPEPHVVRVLVLAVARTVAEGRAEGVDGPVAWRLVAGTQPRVILLTLARVPAGREGAVSGGACGWPRDRRSGKAGCVQGRETKLHDTARRHLPGLLGGGVLVDLARPEGRLEVRGSLKLFGRLVHGPHLAGQAVPGPHLAGVVVAHLWEDNGPSQKA